MNPTIQDTLLDLFQQVAEYPDQVPVVPIDSWQEGSEERQLLTGFYDMLKRIQQNQQRAEEQLRECEGQYRSIFEAVTDGILIVDLKESRVVEVNARGCELFGYTRKEFLGRVVGLSDDSQSPPVYARDVVKAGGQFQRRGVTTGKNGKSFCSEAHAFPFIYKGEPHMLEIVRDITEQVQASEREEQYRSIFEASTDGILIIDLEESRVVEANPKACRLAGYKREEFLGRIVGLSDDTQHPPVYARDVVRSGGFFSKRGIATDREGKTFYADYSASPFIYKGKTHMLQIIHDVTAQVHEEVPYTPLIAHGTGGPVQAEPSLYEGEEQYRNIFEAVIDGLLIINPENDRVVEVNPSACQMFGYSREEFLGQIIIPNDDTQQPPVYARDVVRAGGLFQMRKRLVGKGEKTFEAEVRASPFAYNGLLHMLVVVRDTTVQVQTEQQLREREEQYRSIFEAVTDGILIVDLQDRRLIEVNPSACQMFGYSREEFLGRIIPLVDPTQQPPVHARDVILAGGLFQTRDTGRSKDGKTFYMEVHASPFTYKGQPHMLVVVRDITEQEQAYQLLEQRVEERTHELSTLLAVSHSVAATIELKPLLGLVLDQLKVVADYTGSSFSIVEGENLVLVDNRGPAPLEQVLQLQLPIKDMGLIWEMFCRQEPVIIANVHGDEPLAEAFRAWMKERGKTTFGYIRSWMGIPLLLKEQVIGMLTLSSYEPDFYTSQHARMAMAIGSQAAVAIENARLYEQAQDLAAIQERQRLARELHDSVSQALYGISLGTHTARTLLDRDPRKVAEPLDYVLTLADAALVEMRALIFELRPESLEAEGLVTALRKQAEALQARYGIAVSTRLCEELDVPLKVKKELYRVAQEALHNTVKHAQASKVELRLDSTSNGIFLEIRDNGIGFDPQASFPGHLGLHSMRERITGLDGLLQLQSSPDQGTRISVWLPVESIAKRGTGMLS